MTERPIVCSTREVQAMLRGDMTQMRRVICGLGNIPHYGKLLGDWVLSEPPEIKDGVLHWKLQTDVDDSRVFTAKCPYGQPGDILWVRETWCTHEDLNDYAFEKPVTPGYYFKADAPDWWATDRGVVIWRPSIHMPRIAARLFLRVEDVRVERLQEITEEDARAEGVDYCCPSYRHRGWKDRWISGYCHDCKHHDPMTGKRPTCYFRHSDDESRFRWWCGCSSGSFELRDDAIPEPYRFKFAFVWDEPLKPPFWDSNPWVWVVSFKKLDAALAENKEG